MGDNNYYAPYETESEAESGCTSDTDTDKSDGSSDSAARCTDDPRYAIIRAAGKGFDTINDQLAFSRGNMGAAYSNELVNPSFPDMVAKSPFYINPKKEIVNSLFSFKSEDRDIQVYPFSTYFTLKTPRIYKNITQIQLVQISIQNPISQIPDVSSLAHKFEEDIFKKFGISGCNQCTSNFSSLQGIGISEIGRTNPVHPNSVLVHGISVRPGAYDPASLVSELNQQANLTPPFTTVSYGEHARLFKSTKRVDHLFNEPGKWYRDSLSNAIFTTNNKADIIATYLPDLTLVDSSQPSEQETFVAYFYPVLREAFTNPFDYKFLDLHGVSERSAIQQVLQQYQGLNSPLYYQLCQINLPYLQTLRRSYTFEYSPINDYEWSYNPLSKKIGVVHTHLHKSIQADIAKRYTYDKQQEFLKAGLSTSQLQRQIQTEAVVTDLVHQLDLALVHMGIPYGLYSTGTLYDPSSVIYTSTFGSLPIYYRSNTDQVHLDKITGALVIPDSSGQPLVGSGAFGFNTISTLLNDTAAPLFADPYNSHLLSTNNASLLTRAGGNAIPGYAGVAVTSTDFPSLYSTFLNYQSTNQGLSEAITNASAASISSTTGYITSRYATVLPSSMLTATPGSLPANVGTGGVTWYAGLHVIKPSTPFDREGTPGLIPTTKPLYEIGPFQNVGTVENACCALINLYLRTLYGCIPVNFYVNSDYYKMGFGISTFITFYSTTGLAAAITNNNLYLSLNVEQSMNRMDVARQQNTMVTNETTGEYKTVLGKILTEGGAADIAAQTIVQIPARYDPPLASLDHITFSLLLDDLTPLSTLFPFQIPGTEWDGIIQIDEEVPTLDRATELSTIPTIQYLSTMRQ